jgi:hypothetical protein
MSRTIFSALSKLSLYSRGIDFEAPGFQWNSMLRDVMMGAVALKPTLIYCNWEQVGVVKVGATLTPIMRLVQDA